MHGYKFSMSVKFCNVLEEGSHSACRNVDEVWIAVNSNWNRGDSLIAAMMYNGQSSNTSLIWSVVACLLCFLLNLPINPIVLPRTKSPFSAPISMYS